MESSTAVKRQNFKTKIGIIAVLLGTTALVLSLLPVMDRMGAQRQREGKHSFDQYVLTHHLGKLTLIDTGTGLDPISDALTLAHDVPDATRESFVMNLMEHYVEYDQGQTLSVMYFDTKLNKNVPIGLADYDMNTHKVRLVITHTDGHTNVVSKTVDW